MAETSIKEAQHETERGPLFSSLVAFHRWDFLLYGTTIKRLDMIISNFAATDLTVPQKQEILETLMKDNDMRELLTCVALQKVVLGEETWAALKFE